MLRNYLKIAWRNIKRDRAYTIINMTGLCIALACAIFIFVYVHYELSYEKFFSQAGQIYRLEWSSHNHSGQKSILYARMNSGYRPKSLNAVSGIKGYTRFSDHQLPLFARANHKKLQFSNWWVADSSFFRIFDFHFIAGDRKTALMHSNSIVLSQKMAHKFFGQQNAMGQTLTIIRKQKKVPVTVWGVVKVPPNTHLQFHAVTSKDAAEDLFGAPADYSSGIYYTYLKLRRGQDPTKIAKELTPLKRLPGKVNYRLEPITRIHLHSHARYELSPNSNIRYIYFLSVIAFILLIVAGINFTSLATAQNLQRYKEAGIRKVLGAYRRQLTGQFLAETAGISLAALVISYILVDLTLPAFNKVAGVSLHFSDFFHPVTLIIFIAGTIVLGILAGFYPAVLLSSFQPTRTLKGPASAGKKGASLWKSIVVIQFAVSIAMIICTLTIFRQMHYIQHKDLGFNKSHIITFPNYFGKNHYKAFKARIKKLNGVKNVTVSSYFPGTSKTSGTIPVILSGRPDTLTFDWITGDYNYLATYGIKLKEGRFFSPKHATDSAQAFVLNEAAVKALHLKHPVGAPINVGRQKGTIIGVTQNFNFLSLYQKIPPIVFWMDNRMYWNFSVKLVANVKPSTVIGNINRVWKDMLPNIPFKYQFVDQQFDALYKTDRQMGRVFGIFAILALFISCLGLFSLSSFMAARKTKEIGIRKVLGASTQNILSSFYKSYSLLVGIACLFAVPASYIFLRKWLNNYAYRIGMPVWVFLAAIGAALLIAILAVSAESMKAALANPVDSLKSE